MKLMVGMFFALALAAAPSSAREVPVGDFFKDAEFTTLELSPDGKHMAITVPQADRNLLVVMSVADRKVVATWNYGENRYFRDVAWANDKRLLFRVGLRTGEFDFEIGRADLYASNIDGSNRIDIPNGSTYSIVDMTPEDPDTVLVRRSIEGTFLSKLNVNNGKITTVATAPIDGGSFLVDRRGAVRFAFGEMNDGRAVTYARRGEKWELIHEGARGGATYVPVGMTPDDRHVYFAKGPEGEPEMIVSVEPETGEETLVSGNRAVAPSALLWSSDGSTLLGVNYDDGQPYWDFIAPDHPEAKIFASLSKSFPGKAVSFLNTTRDGRLIAFRVYSDRDPGSIYLFDRQSGNAKFLMAAMDWIKPEEMSPMKAVTIRARDGRTLHGYLTVPAGSDGRKLPLIVNPHGGPHGVRDYWGFNEEVQFLANRGYAVLQVNYRGSGGYGNAFERAGYRNWGTSMQDDLTDSVRSLVGQGIVDPSRICIYGGSYGGYAALMSAEREPDLYRCAVGYAGVYDLAIQKTDSDTSDFKAGRSYLNDVYPTALADRRAQSPVYGVDRLKAAVMLVHGEKDMRVPIKNMRELIDRMKQAGKVPEDVVVAPKEAHGFRAFDNKVDLYTRMQAFFDRHIGQHRTVSGSARAE